MAVTTDSEILGYMDRCPKDDGNQTKSSRQFLTMAGNNSLFFFLVLIMQNTTCMKHMSCLFYLPSQGLQHCINFLILRV